MRARSEAAGHPDHYLPLTGGHSALSDSVAALDVLRSIAACPVVRSMSDTTTVPDSRRDQVETLTLEELAHELECSRWLVDDRIDPSVISRRALLSDDLVHGLAQR